MNSCQVYQLKFHYQLIFELSVLISNACYNCFLTGGGGCASVSVGWLKLLTAFKCAVLFIEMFRKVILLHDISSSHVFVNLVFNKG